MSTIVVYPGGWGDTVPYWLKNAITLERMLANMGKNEATGTEAEACIYLMTVSLSQPIDSDWVQIYLYVAGKTNKQWNNNDMPDDIAVNEISNYQMGKLVFKTINLMPVLGFRMYYSNTSIGDC